uniref:Fibronectin type-III domain-containing protein n=1 Tax=Pyrodinium bahamense TaxID=73915 RepID=A0A7S0A7G0_9DINO
MNNGLGGTIWYHTTVEDTSQRWFTATGLVTNREHLVQVTVVSAVTESERSSTLAVRSCGAPGTPDAPVRKSSTSTSITVEWSAPEDNGCPMTGYRIYLDENGDDVADQEIHPGAGDDTNPIDPSLDPTVLEVQKTGLNTGQEYGFQVRAYNARGSTYSVWSTIKAASEPLQMDPPTALIMSSTSTSIMLKWILPDLQGGTAVGYKVFRNNGVGTTISPTPDTTCQMEFNPAPQQCMVSGLTPGEDYLFQMLTINDIGEGPLSITTSLKSATVPARIDTHRNTLSKLNPASLKFEWTAPADNGATIYNYNGELHFVDDGSVKVWSGNGELANPFTATEVLLVGPGPQYNLYENKQYKFRLQAENIMGLGIWSEWTSLTEAPRGFTLDPPITPRNFGRHTDTPVAGYVKLSWDAYADYYTPPYILETGGDQLAHITYEVWGGKTTLVQLNMTDDQATTHTEAVPAGETWYFKVRGMNSAGLTSPFTATLAMISAEVPGKPNLTSATSTTAGEVVLLWDVPAGITGAPIIRYEVSNDNFVASKLEVVNTATSYAFSGQSQGARLTYYVRAVNAVGPGLSDSESVCVHPGPCP